MRGSKPENNIFMHRSGCKRFGVNPNFNLDWRGEKFNFK
jgi:hypothetical protein